MVRGLIWIWCVSIFSTICYARLLPMAHRNPLRRVIAVQNWWIVAIAKDFQIALASMGYIGLSLFSNSIDEIGLIGGVVAAVLNQFTLWNYYGTALPRSVSRTWKLYSNSPAKAAEKIRGWKLKKKSVLSWHGFQSQHVGFLHDATCKVFQLIAAGRFPELLTTCEELENCWDEMTSKCQVNTFVSWFLMSFFVFISVISILLFGKMI